MLENLKRLLGWEGESSLLDLVRLGSRSRKAPPFPKPLVTAIPTPPRRVEQPPASPRPERDRDMLEVLDNPRLSLDKPSDDNFDPYNTGAFNRSASWERIGRQRKR